MGRTTIRAAITTYLGGLNLPYVGTVYSSRPMIVSEADYDRTMSGTIVTSPNGSSAVLVVNLPDDHRERKSDTGRGAVDDANIHQTVVEVFSPTLAGTQSMPKPITTP